MRRKTTRVICNSHDPEHRPALCLSPLAIEDLTDEPQFSLTQAGRAEVHAAAPRVTITLDARQLDIVARYRQAKDAMRAAITQAIANQGPDKLWTPDDRDAVEVANDALVVCQIEMCALLDVAVLTAGM